MQTLTMGYGGSMKVPGGPELNMTTTQQLAELQLTLPDLVDRYKEICPPGSPISKQSVSVRD
jgi:hypothetical protein